MTMPVPRSGLQGSYGRDGGCHRTPNLPYLQSSPGDFITPGGGASESVVHLQPLEDPGVQL